MGVGLLVALALFAAGIWFMTGVAPGRGQRPGAGRPQLPDLEPVTDVEVAEEVRPEAERLAGHGAPEGGRPEAAVPAGGSATSGPAENSQPAAAVSTVGGHPAETVAPGAFDPAFEVGAEVAAFEPAGRPPADWGGPPLPAGADAITATVRDPRSISVDWDLSGGGQERLRSMLGEERFRATTPCLRIFDTGSDRVRTVDLNEQDDRAHIADLEPGRRYIIALERRAPEGDRYLLALSRPVDIPLEVPEAAGLRGLSPPPEARNE